MKKPFLLIIIFCILIGGCKSKEEAAAEKLSYFPVLSFLKGQVAHIDTSLYTITQITKTNNSADTVFLKREDFKKAAADFLSIPDISSKKLKGQYEETKMYDDELGKVIINYQPKDKAEAPIQREEVLVLPVDGVNDAVQTIYIEQLLSGDDSTVLKKMLWEVDRRFQVISIIQKEGAPEKVKTVEVAWSHFPSAK